MSELFATLEVVARADRYNQWVMAHFRPYLSGVVFDVGSGRGDMAELYDLPSVDRIILSDHAPEMAAFLQKRFAGRKPRYEVLPLADISALERSTIIQEHLPDTVIALNVLEHIDDDVAAIGNMTRILAPGGRLLIMVPALPAIHGSLDNMVGHVRRYTRRELGQKMVAAGLQVERAYYMNALGVFSWFIAGRILRQQRFDPVTCAALDRIVPFLRAMESFCPPPFGQSLILIARKRPLEKTVAFARPRT
ncbi:MAG: methyltransferase domain-containing protein [Candidatus Omnitrophica bacterium]|nr:methyltransferase domain-containing protein [Candidatus Omnitrophota bacterium]